MLIKHILARLDGSDGDAAVLDYALQIATRMPAHVDGVFCRFEPQQVSQLMAMPTAKARLDAFVAKYTEESCERARQNFTVWLKHNGLIEDEIAASGCSFSWRDVIGRETEVLARIGRLTDLTVLAHPTRDTASGEMAFETALFDTRRPVLLVPRSVRFDLFYRPIIAWNGSPEAAQAVAGAMALLAQSADSVEVFTAPEEKHRSDLRELISYLRWHGIMAAPTPPDDAGVPIAESLLRQATMRRAGFVVMGAYTHGHFRQFIFGGVTRHMIDHATMPVLMAH